MPSEKGLDESFLLVLPDLHLGSFLKCDLLPRTGSGRTRHHPSRACCRWQMAPRHPTTRLFDRRASDRSRGAPIGRQITAIQPLLLFVRYSLLACLSPSHGRKHPEDEPHGPYNPADRRNGAAMKARHLSPTE